MEGLHPSIVERSITRYDTLYRLRARMRGRAVDNACYRYDVMTHALHTPPLWLVPLEQMMRYTCLSLPYLTYYKLPLPHHAAATAATRPGVRHR
jgi:hypothetical protein